MNEDTHRSTQEACQTLGKAIDSVKTKGEKPKEMWFQLRDRCYIALKDDAARLAKTTDQTEILAQANDRLKGLAAVPQR